VAVVEDERQFTTVTKHRLVEHLWPIGRKEVDQGVILATRTYPLLSQSADRSMNDNSQSPPLWQRGG